MRPISLVYAVALIALLLGGLATRASALGDLPFQVLLNDDGSGKIFMNDGTHPDWKACRPDLTECTPFATGDFDTGEAPPETVFWAGGNLLTPIWKGTLNPIGPPSVQGKVQGNHVVTPVAGQWAGGWANDYGSLSLAICRTARGANCLTINHEGPEHRCGAAGSTLVDPAFAGRYLLVTDRRYGSGTAFAGVGHPFYYPAPELVPGPTVSLAVVGKIAPATGPPSIKCGPPPLIGGSISHTGSAEVKCGVVGCRAVLVAHRDGQTAWIVRHLPEDFVWRRVTLRFTPAALKRLGRGPVRLVLEVNGNAIAHRTVNGGLAEE